MKQKFENFPRIHESLEPMQKDLDTYLHHYNHERAHQGRNMNGRVPYQAFIDELPKSETTTEEAA